MIAFHDLLININALTFRMPNLGGVLELLVRPLSVATHDVRFIDVSV